MRIKLIISIAVLALMAACNGTADNKPAANTTASNANANAANTATAPKAAAPTAEALIAIEKKAWEDWASRNAGGLETYMASKFVNVGSNGATVRADAIKSWTAHKCEMKELDFSNEKVTELSDGVVLLTFQAKSDIKCDGKAGPDPLNVSVLYVKEGDAWKSVYYQEVPAADAKGEYQPPSTPFDKEKELASLSAAPDDLAVAEKKLWDTWKAQDRKGFEAHIADNIVANGSTGLLDRTKYMAMAFESDCKIDTISLGPMRSMEITKDLTMIFYRAAVKGTCGKEATPANTIATSIYKRENGTPKAVYFMESPVRP